ncbi:MAG: TIR domain-containing protein [Promethearchaeota archaeon]|nr:MAG: TIR domain-containing protein [Candidatus Lokiarchaeota archaeon]
MSDIPRVKPKQAKVLADLEELTDQSMKIAFTDQDWSDSRKFISWNTFGALIKDGDVIDLNLYNCCLKSLPESIGNLRMLNNLRCKRNQIEKLPESFGRLTSLRTLDFSVDNQHLEENNRLKLLPNSFGNLTSLEVLNLSDNKLKSLPDSFGRLSSLKELKLEDNKLELLPTSIGNLKSLEKLDLGGNCLTELPESIGNLESLKTLILGGNQLELLPTSIGNLKTLESLILAQNKLINLPNSIGGLQSLYSLVLEENNLAALPDEIGKLTRLGTLNLNFNKLTSIPDTIGKLENLKFLELNNNQLTAIPDTIMNLKSLMELFLEHNLISMPPLSLWHLRNLEVLKLDNNPLESEFKDVMEQNVPTILEYFREKATIKIFISHAVADFEPFQIKEISDFLESKEHIYQAYYCEEDLVGDIDKFMNETIPKCQVLFFFASKKSVFESIDCAHELDLAKRHNIPVYAVKGEDVQWNDIQQIGLNKDRGLEFKKSFIKELMGRLLEISLEIKAQEPIKEPENTIDEVVEELKKKLNEFFSMALFKHYLQDKIRFFEQNFQQFSDNAISAKQFFITFQNQLLSEFPKEETKQLEPDKSIEQESRKNLDKKQKKVLKQIEKIRGRKLPDKSIWIENGNIVSLNLDGYQEEGKPSILQYLPDSIGDLTKLRQLTLSHNQLESLPDAICNLTMLEYLNLEENRLKALPRCLWKCQNLTFLKLTFNPWEDELAPFAGMREGFDGDYMDEILQVIWNRSAINVFISSTSKDFESFNLKRITKMLAEEGEIDHIYYGHEKDEESLQKGLSNYQLVLFIASNASIHSDKCKYEINQAKSNKIPVIPIKTREISWNDLELLDLSRDLGMEYDPENLEKFGLDLIEYIKQFKREVNLFYPEEERINKQLANLTNTINNYLDSEQFKASISDLKKFRQDCDDYFRGKITLPTVLREIVKNIE